MSASFVAVLMGSESDWPVVQTGVDLIKRLGMTVEVRIASAHRTPLETHEYVRDADQRGCAVFICCAGMAAHLAGSVAAITVKPVLGVPMEAGGLGGIDALLATVQMPAGVPVACLAIGKAGIKNAAYLAAQILALHDTQLAQNLREDRLQQAQAIKQKNANLKY